MSRLVKDNEESGSSCSTHEKTIEFWKLLGGISRGTAFGIGLLVQSFYFIANNYAYCAENCSKNIKIDIFEGRVLKDSQENMNDDKS